MSDKKKLPAAKPNGRSVEKLFQEFVDSLSDEDRQLVEEVAQEFAGSFSDDDDSAQLVTRSFSFLFQGPLPPPGLLKGYAEVDPTIPGKSLSRHGMSRKSDRDATGTTTKQTSRRLIARL